jgi:MerR family transcriptional regulator, light-induced transcriptional regulator
MISQIPVYNLMVVLKETGLKADALRAWERRYDLPHPQRTAGRQRLYSDYDIATIKWLKNKQAEGLSISRAIQLWKDLMAAGINPLEDVANVKATPSLSQTGGMSIEILRQIWLESCLAFDAVKAEDAMNQAFALYPVEIACSAILRHGLNIIGEQWYLGKVSVQQEHFASSLAIRRIETLLSAAPQLNHQETVLVGCPEGEMHIFPAIMLSLFLQRKGLKVVYLGADIPMEQLDTTIEAIHPNLVVLCAQQLVSAASLSVAALALQEHHIPLAYGGLIFNRVPEVRQHIAATFLGESLEAASDKVEQLVQSPAFLIPIQVNEKFQALAQSFRLSRPLIENELYAALQKEGVQIGTIEEVNNFLGSELSAALDLGDPAFIEGELIWINGLLTSHHLPVEQLRTYLGEYSRCVHNILGVDGNPITQWIDQFVTHP